MPDLVDERLRNALGKWLLSGSLEDLAVLPDELCLDLSAQSAKHMQRIRVLLNYFRNRRNATQPNAK